MYIYIYIPFCSEGYSPHSLPCLWSFFVQFSPLAQLSGEWDYKREKWFRSFYVKIYRFVSNTQPKIKMFFDFFCTVIFVLTVLWCLTDKLLKHFLRHHHQYMFLQFHYLKKSNWDLVSLPAKYSLLLKKYLQNYKILQIKITAL